MISMTDTICKIRRAGLTLIEVVVVVVIVAILSAVAIPRFQSRSEEAEQAAFIESLRVFVDAAFLFKADTGSFPENSDSGTLGSDGFADYVNSEVFAAVTPIGGLWDVQRAGASGQRAGLGVHFSNSDSKSTAYMAQIDAMIDDGNLATGKFRQTSKLRFYFVLAE